MPSLSIICRIMDLSPSEKSLEQYALSYSGMLGQGKVMTHIHKTESKNTIFDYFAAFCLRRKPLGLLNSYVQQLMYLQDTGVQKRTKMIYLDFLIPLELPCPATLDRLLSSATIMQRQSNKRGPFSPFSEDWFLTSAISCQQYAVILLGRYYCDNKLRQEPTFYQRKSFRPLH